MALTARSKEFAENYSKIIRSQLPPFRHSMDFYGDQKINDAIRNYKLNRTKIEEEFFQNYWQKNRTGREEAIKHLENVIEKFCVEYKTLIQEKLFENPDVGRGEIEQILKDEKRKILQGFESSRKIGSDDFYRGKKLELEARLDVIGNGMARQHRESCEGGSLHVEDTHQHGDNYQRSLTSSMNASINSSAPREEIAGPSGIQQHNRRKSSSDAGLSQAKKPRRLGPVAITIEEQEDAISGDEDGDQQCYVCGMFFENYHILQDHAARRHNATRWPSRGSSNQENSEETSGNEMTVNGMPDSTETAEAMDVLENEGHNDNDPDYEASSEEEEENVARTVQRRCGYRRPMVIPSHIGRVSVEGKIYYQCWICPRGQLGRSRSHIVNHKTCPYVLEVFAENQFFYQCKICDERRRVKGELKQHINSTHKNYIDTNAE